MRLVTGPVEPSVAGTSAPEDDKAKFSVIACGRGRQARIGKRLEPEVDVSGLAGP
jgi:hypothetical protein